MKKTLYFSLNLKQFHFLVSTSLSSAMRDVFLQIFSYTDLIIYQSIKKLYDIKRQEIAFSVCSMQGRTKNRIISE